MHGRLKVKTTEQQNEQKRKEREYKLKLFLQGSEIAFKKVQKQEYDEVGLEVTQQLLLANSDISSLWNYRKNVFLALKVSKSHEDLYNLYKNELEFIVGCLRKNPKSYGCWHQRCFVMLHMPNPDWKKELELCDLFLELDERNFHCWDYRRFVVKNSTVLIPVQSELKITQKLIETNFSNYSSWHYRSKLLPMKYPDQHDSSRIEEKKLLEELELVQNAFFTDPEDQSAWFYHRWLLGRGRPKQNIISLHFEAETGKVFLSFRHAVDDVFCQSLSVQFNEKQMQCSWQRCIPQLSYQHVWITTTDQLSSPHDCTFNITNGDGSICSKLCIKKCNGVLKSQNISKTEFMHSLSSSKKSVLQAELESCQQLNELEPGNKWAVLTLVLLMRAIDPDKYKDEVRINMKDLETIDDKRRMYYHDTMSAYSIEDVISSIDNMNHVNLSNMNLSRLCHLHYFSGLSSLNISHNNLSKFPTEIAYLWNCKEIIANNNSLQSLDGLEMLVKLEKLDVGKNCLDSPISIQPLLKCKNLQMISLVGNKVIQHEKYNQLISMFSNINFQS